MGPSVAAVVVAAGRGIRAGGNLPKQYRHLAGEPVIRSSLSLLSWHGPEESVAAVLENHVWTKQVWTAAIEGHEVPDRDEQADAIALMERHDAVAPRWLAAVRDIDRRGAWDDAMIDALCDPPQSFVIGAVVAHVLTFAAGRRQVVRDTESHDALLPLDSSETPRWRP